ncbi:hypothetical protein AAVH_10977 [Aphelenchoides avenae]|nr:hypothetical protein AAVH_10977 [Aphelenchus avenae]
MLRVRVLLLITAHLLLLCAEPSHDKELSSISGRDEVKPDSCGKDCEDRTRIRSRPKAKCELYYFAPTATQQEQFGFWNITRVEHRKAYYKIVPFLKENAHENRPIFFPAHMPLVEKSNKGREVLVLKDVYVRALGTCGNMEKAWYDNTDLKLQTKVEMVEDYVERMPRSHWGYRMPKAGENDVCLDDTGLVVKDFSDIRTCFSMWTRA